MQSHQQGAHAICAGWPRFGSTNDQRTANVNETNETNETNAVYQSINSVLLSEIRGIHPHNIRVSDAPIAQLLSICMKRQSIKQAWNYKKGNRLD
jgi:hypothetical protein